MSASWILSANSWMHTPTGFEAGANNQYHPLNWLDIIFNPSFPYRLLHMVTAAYLTTAFVVGGVAAWYLRKQRHLHHAKIMLGMAMIMAIFVAPIQIFLGDLHGLNTLQHQPRKVAAIEALWETQRGAALTFFALPNVDQEKNNYAIEIPKLGSLILTHRWDGEVKGLKEWPKAERPPVTAVFFAFRIMVGIGLLMVLTGVFAIILNVRKRLFETKWFQSWCMMMTPMGFIAVLSGWMVTEMGRQPFVVYDLLRTSEAISPVLGENVLLSLISFVLVYAFVFGAGIYYILKLIKEGPKVTEKEEKHLYGEHGVQHPVLLSDVFKGLKNGRGVHA